MNKYLRPSLGETALDAITNHALRDTFDGMATDGLAPKTIRLALAVTTAILNDAVDADAIARSPVGRLAQRYAARRRPVAVYDEASLARFLTTAAGREPTLAAFFMVCARAGLRVGEARGLCRTDIDVDGKRLRVLRQLDRHRGTEGPPKGGQTRSVDLTASLLHVLESQLAARGARWLFPEAVGVSGYKRLWNAFRQIATAAELPVLSMHSLRHSYASILIARGVSPAYVQRQLGHRSVALTVDLYGSHLPMVRSTVLDSL